MDKLINKLIESPWSIRIIALLVALLLFDYVYGREEQTVNVPQDQEKEVIEQVPVKLLYDTENFVVSGVPETVTVTLTGPRASVQQARIQKNFEVFIDLTEAEIGTQKVPIQIRDISEKLSVIIDPGSVNVSVQEKVTKELSIEAEYNHAVIAEGYIAEKASIDPGKVKITGGKDVVEKITYVKATVDITGPINETLTKKATVLAFDQQLNKLNVDIEPSEVTVTIPIKASSKTVPIRVLQKGTLQDGFEIESITLDMNEAALIAEENVLKQLNAVWVELDVSEITGDIEVTLPITKENGIVEMNPLSVKATIKVVKKEDRTFSNLPIEVEGLSNEMQAVFRDPSHGETSIIIYGRNEEISQLSEDSYQLYVDLSALSEGEHEVAVRVKGPTGLTWKLQKESVKVSIMKKEA